MVPSAWGTRDGSTIGWYPILSVTSAEKAVETGTAIARTAPAVKVARVLRWMFILALLSVIQRQSPPLYKML